MALFEDSTLAEARTIIARYPAGRERSAVMPLLYLAQSIEGRVTRQGLQEVAALLELTTAEVEAVASFYTMLRLKPTNTHVVSVCTNLSSALPGSRTGVSTDLAQKTLPSLRTRQPSSSALWSASAACNSAAGTPAVESSGVKKIEKWRPTTSSAR